LISPRTIIADDLPPPPPELDPREPPAPTSTPHRTPSRAQHVTHGSSNPSYVGGGSDGGHGLPGTSGLSSSSIPLIGPSAIAARSARSSPVGSRANSPAPAVGSPLGRAAEEIINQETASNSNIHSSLSSSQDPSSMIFERDVTLFAPPTDLSHKPSRLGSPSPHHHPHGDALDGKVPTVLDDAIQALSAECMSGPGFYGMGGAEGIEIEGPVSAVHWRTRPGVSGRPSGTSEVGLMGTTGPVGERSPTDSHMPGTSSPLSGGSGEDTYGVSNIPTAISSPEIQASNPHPIRPEMPGPQPSTGPSLPGAFPLAAATSFATTATGPATSSPVKDWKRKMKEWVGPKPGPGVFPDDIEEPVQQRGRPNVTVGLTEHVRKTLL
jgi:hypothetical protein